MRFIILLVAALIIALAVSALRILEAPASFGFFQGALTLGGGLLICLGFTFRMKWHGYIGAGILALLGFAKGLGNMVHLVRPDTEALMEVAVTVACGALLATVTRTLLSERKRRQAEKLRESP